MSIKQDLKIFKIIQFTKAKNIHNTIKNIIKDLTKSNKKTMDHKIVKKSHFLKILI